MSKKMSKKEMNFRLERISTLTGIRFYIERWAPGDRVRYRVMRQLASGGEGKMSHYVPYSQLETVLDAMQNIAELMSGQD